VKTREIEDRAAWLVVFLCLFAGFAGCRGNVNGGETSNQQQAPAPATATPASEPSSGRPKIVALGDSLTAGLGLPQTEAYPALLQQKLQASGYEYDVVNAGVSGDTSAGGLRRLDWALQGDVRVLILALGANDGLRGLPVAAMKRNLGQIIERAEARNIIVILAGMEAPPNYGPEYTAAFRRAYEDLAREYDVRFLPFLLANVAGNSALNQGDGIHPNTQGAAMVADGLWAVLRPVLDEVSAAS
jgi:acyl-CoA thioesterase-1